MHGPSRRAPEGPDRLRFPRWRRITRGMEIRTLFRRGKRSKTTHLDVFDSASPAPRSRAAIVVPRHRRSAVERNRLKRVLREAVRLEVLPRLDGFGASRDVLVRARPEAYAASYRQLTAELVEWLERRWRREPPSS